MVEILMGLSRESRRKAVMTRIEKACKAGKRRIYLLVPEQSTFNATRDVCRQLGNSLPNGRVKVIGFEQLFEAVYTDCGEYSEHMDEGGRLLAMAAAVSDKKPELNIFQGSANRPEFLRDLVVAYNTMNHHEVLDTLPSLVESAPTEVLKNKLADLDTIFSAYEELAEKSKLDPTKKILQIAEILNRKDWLDGTHWFIDDYMDFSGLQMKIITAIMNKAEQVTITLAAEGPKDKRQSSQLLVETARKLRCAAEHGECKIVTLENESGASPELSYLQSELCDSAHPVMADMKGGEVFRIFEDPTPYKECLHVAGEIMKDVRNGHRYNDISVVLCQYDKYAPILSTVFKKYGIHAYFGSTRDDIGKKPIMLAVNSALMAATRGMPQQEVLQFLKSGVSNLTMHEVDILEEYARAYRIRGRAWEPGEMGWIMNPNGIGKDFTEEDTALLETINELRVKGISPLLKLKDAMHAAKTIAEYTEALYNFLESIQFVDRLQEIVDKLHDDGEVQTAKEYGQVADVLATVMEQMHGVGWEIEKTAHEFVKLFKLVCSSYKIATIPVNLDEVEVLSLQDARYTASKNRYILGAEEGAFPSFAPPIAILSGDELKDLDECGVKLPGTDFDVTQRGLAEVYAVISGAKEKLVLSYANDPHSPATPSHLVARAQKLLQEVTPVGGAKAEYGNIYEADMMTAKAIGKLIGRLTYRDEYDKFLCEACRIKDATLQVTSARVVNKARWIDVALKNLSIGTVQDLYGHTIPLSATRTEVYSNCRYHYFLKYGLKLRQPKMGFFDQPVFGTFAHAVLEEVMQELEGMRHDGAEPTRDQVSDCVKKHIAVYTAEHMRGLEHQSEQYIYHYKWQCRELMAIAQNFCEEMKVSDFRPIGFEYKIGGEDADAPAIRIDAGDGISGSFTGVADRIDACTLEDGRTFIRIYDYKTGRVQTFNTSEIYNGFGLQILLYHEALRNNNFGPDGTSAEVAGGFYVPAKDAIISSSKKLDDEKLTAELNKALKRHGYIYNDKLVLYAMEHIENNQSRFLPVKFSKEGELIGDNIMDAELMDILPRYARAYLYDVCADVKSGNIRPNPISHGMDRTSCSHCPYRQVCHKDMHKPKYRYTAKEPHAEALAKIKKRLSL